MISMTSFLRFFLNNFNNWGMRLNCCPMAISIMPQMQSTDLNLNPGCSFKAERHVCYEQRLLQSKRSQVSVWRQSFVVFNLSEVVQWLCYCSRLHKRCETWAMAHSVTKMLAWIWALCFIDFKLRTPSEWNHCQRYFSLLFAAGSSGYRRGQNIS